jgi:hypothetical protein
MISLRPCWLRGYLSYALKAIVCDNLKAGVTAASRYEPGINRTYQELAEHYDAAILPTRDRTTPELADHRPDRVQFILLISPCP